MIQYGAANYFKPKYFNTVFGPHELEEERKSGYWRLWLHNLQKERNEEGKIKDAVKEVVAKITPEKPVTKVKAKPTTKKVRTVEPEISVPELPPFKKAPVYTEPSVHEQLAEANIMPMLMLSVTVSEILHVKLIEDKAANDEEFNRNFLLLVAA